MSSAAAQEQGLRLIKADGSIPHYSVWEADWSMDDLRRHVRIDGMNWLLLSTSGVHGSYASLDDLRLDLEAKAWGSEITFLYIQPRRVRMICGNVKVRGGGDYKWLRDRVEESLRSIVDSQRGNRRRNVGGDTRTHDPDAPADDVLGDA